MILLLVSVSSALLLGLIYAGWTCARRRRRAKLRERWHRTTFEVVARAESLAELALVLDGQPHTSKVWDVIHDEHRWLIDAIRELRQNGVRLGFRFAAAELTKSLTLVNEEVSRQRAQRVPSTPTDQTNADAATARMRDRARALVVSARFLGVVADIEGC